MRIIADLHIHSKYSRTTSKDMNLDVLADWARIKGIDLLGTGDFTHPAHFTSITERLEPLGNGLFTLKGKKTDAKQAHFMLTAEVSNIYTQGGKTRKIHNLIFAPTTEAARKMNSAFAKLGNINSDGRPIFGFSAIDLIKIVLNASPDAMVVPAHVWTPWFSIFGSKSGFDSIEECFGDYAKHIHAIETGLSSSPDMNWRLSALDNITLISNSDAHSPSKLGREANVLDSEMDYTEVTGILKKQGNGKFLYTVEFFPEEGKYHYDGHRECGILFSPKETEKASGVCPVCGSPVTVGVMNRVARLADRPDGFTPTKAVPSRYMVPLEEILAEVHGAGVNTKKVQADYKKLTALAGSEFAILLDMEIPEIEKMAGEKTAEAVALVRTRKINIVPGFDGEFGKIKIFGEVEEIRPTGPSQITLF